jgi:anti-sigma B factor antagonist
MMETAGEKYQIAVVRPAGRMMGPPETTRLHKRVKSHIEKGVPRVVIDLGNVDWLNSKGIGALVSSLMSCRNAGGEMVVARPSKRVKSIFMVSQLVKLFDSYATLKEAKSALSTMQLTPEN